MTPVGHTLLGAAVGTLCLPRESSWQRTLGHTAAFMLLANLPDLPLPFWGHQRYEISHSLFVNLLLILAGLVVLGARPARRRQLGGWVVLAAGAGAWLSHLLLDSFYNHGRGVAMFWPFSEARLALPISWFSVVRHPPPFTARMWKEFAVELGSFGLLLAAAVGWRWLRQRSTLRRTPCP
jgi:membrane-bound metal-dependent hydrolase YbcI (DUF457 family)